MKTETLSQIYFRFDRKLRRLIIQADELLMKTTISLGYALADFH